MRAGFTWLLVLPLVVAMARHVQLVIAPPSGLLTAIKDDDDQTRPQTEAAFRGPIVDRRGRPLAISTPGIQLFVDLVARREKHEYELDTEARRARFPEGVKPVTKQNLRLMDFALEVAHLFPELHMSPEEIKAVLHEADLKNRANGRETRYCKLGDVLHQTPSIVARQQFAKSTHLNRILLAGLHWKESEIRTISAPQSLRSLVGKTMPDKDGLKGRDGIEAKCNARLSGTMGHRHDVVDSRGRRLEGSAAQPAIDGRTVTMTLDLDLQEYATTELEEAVASCHAAGGRLMVLDVATGGLLSMVDVLAAPREGTWPDAPADDIRPQGGLVGRPRCISDVFEPGSTFKPIVWAIAVEEGVVQPSELIDAVPPGKEWLTSYGRRIRDVSGRGNLKWDEVLRYSKNACMAHVADRLSTTKLRDRVLDFGFGKRTRLVPRPEDPNNSEQNEPEARGLVPQSRNWNNFTQTSVSFGQNISVTAAQLLQGISILASGGELRPIHLVNPGPNFRPARIPVVSAATAQATIDAMVPLVQDTKHLRIQGVRAFGKSGTAQLPRSAKPEQGIKHGMYEDRYICSFIMGAPAEDPKVLVLCTIDDPDRYALERENLRHTGSYTAGPVAKKVLEAALGRLGVPREIANASNDAPVGIN